MKAFIFKIADVDSIEYGFNTSDYPVTVYDLSVRFFEAYLIYFYYSSTI